MTPVADNVTVGGCKWLEKIHISKHIWLIMRIQTQTQAFFTAHPIPVHEPLTN